MNIKVDNCNVQPPNWVLKLERKKKYLRQIMDRMDKVGFTYELKADI